MEHLVGWEGEVGILALGASSIFSLPFFRTLEDPTSWWEGWGFFGFLGEKWGEKIFRGGRRRDNDGDRGVESECNAADSRSDEPLTFSPEVEEVEWDIIRIIRNLRELKCDGSTRNYWNNSLRKSRYAELREWESRKVKVVKVKMDKYALYL